MCLQSAASCQSDEIGEIVFTLGIVVHHLTQQFGHEWPGTGHDA